MRSLIVILVIALAAVLAGACVAYEPALEPVRPGVVAEPELVARGARLAAIGNCRGCHTARDGPALGGGVPLHSPFGTIYSTNISPDADTGIGRWSEAAFQRAMREGVARDGHHLYPAFPYERFTRVTDDDNRAIYAWLMSQPAVKWRPPKNELAFPFNLRAGIALWKLAFFEEGPRDTPLTAEARGHYLVDGLGHCGSCHSPRNWAQAEDLSHELQGGDAEGWHAYAIEASNRSPLPWTAEELAFYLRHGYHPRHGIARGTMGLVTGELAFADPADVAAMAQAIASRMQARGAGPQDWAQAVEKAPLNPKGATAGGEPEAIYRTTCAECHDGSAPLPYGGLPLAMSTGLRGESPRNLVNVILHGIAPPGDGRTGPQMPGFAGALSDAQVEALATWLRANFTDQPAWQDVARAVAASRGMEASMLRFPPGGTGSDPATRGAR